MKKVQNFVQNICRLLLVKTNSKATSLGKRQFLMIKYLSLPLCWKLNYKKNSFGNALVNYTLNFGRKKANLRMVHF